MPSPVQIIKEFPKEGELQLTAALDGLPDGMFMTLEASVEQAYLVRGDGLLEWSPAGYRERRRRPKG